MFCFKIPKYSWLLGDCLHICTPSTSNKTSHLHSTAQRRGGSLHPSYTCTTLPWSPASRTRGEMSSFHRTCVTHGDKKQKTRSTHRQLEPEDGDLAEQPKLCCPPCLCARSDLMGSHLPTLLPAVPWRPASPMGFLLHRLTGLTSSVLIPGANSIN